MRNMHMLFIILSLSLPIFFPSSLLAFGAIAIDNNGGKGQPAFGIVVKQGTANMASQAALSKCTSSGGKNCRLVVNFDEKCGAVAASAKSSGAGWGIRRMSARNMAHRNCGDDCEIVGIECEDD